MKTTEGCSIQLSFLIIWINQCFSGDGGGFCASCYFSNLGKVWPWLRDSKWDSEWGQLPSGSGLCLMPKRKPQEWEGGRSTRQTMCAGSDSSVASAAAQGGRIPWLQPLALGCPWVFQTCGSLLVFQGSWKRLWALRQGWFKRLHWACGWEFPACIEGHRSKKIDFLVPHWQQILF